MSRTTGRPRGQKWIPVLDEDGGEVEDEDGGSVCDERRAN